jgi:uncharacterized membrane protein HdeD (DUF308 family)
MLEYFSRYWWTVALRGALAVAFGVVALIWPDITLHALVLLFGFYALVDGLLALAALLVGGRLVADRRGWLVVEGIAGIVAGVVSFLWPGITALVLLYLIAVWAIATGLLEVAWTVVPFLIVAGLFVLTWGVLNRVDARADNPRVVLNVVGFQWQWQFTYQGERVPLPPDQPPEDLTIKGTITKPPVMYLPVMDAHAFVFNQAYQSIGLGLGAAIGAAVADPGRVTVAALGDGGTFMSLGELETAARLRLPLLVVVYNDDAYGAEVHHFAEDPEGLDLVRFPETDLAAVGRAVGADGVTVRAARDLEPVASWLARRDRPMVVDAKVTPTVVGEWLEEAFRGG